MTIKEKIRANRAIRQVAEREGKSPAEIRQAMQEAIDTAWANPAGRAMQQQLFPAGKPTVEEFLLRTARKPQAS